MGLGRPWGAARKYCRGLSPAHHPHAALRAVERAGASRLEAAVRAGQAGSPPIDGEPRRLRLAQAVPRREDLLVERAEELLADALGVAAQPLAAPSDHGAHDELARQLVPVRREAADDGVVLGVAARVGLAVEQAAEKVSTVMSSASVISSTYSPWRPIGLTSRRARTHCWISLKRSMAGEASEYSSGSGSIVSTGVWLSGSTIPGWPRRRDGSAGRRRPSLLRATKARRSRYSCAFTSSCVGVGGGGGAAASGFLRLRNDIVGTRSPRYGGRRAILPAAPRPVPPWPDRVTAGLSPRS
jgi:hypothetical protein